jgi:hypothetical protein
MKETEIFLSYAHEDRSRVERILHAFKSRGWNVFMDQDIFSGANWRKVLESQLETAYAVVVVWSSHSVGSEWVAREAMAGLAKDRLFPVLIDRDVTLPSSFEHKHAVDLSDWEGDPNDPKFDRLLGMIHLLWEAEKGLRQDIKVLKPLRLNTGPRPSG